MAYKNIISIIIADIRVKILISNRFLENTNNRNGKKFRFLAKKLDFLQ